MKLSFGKVMKIGCLCVLTAAMVIAVCSIVVFRRSGCSEHKFEFKLHDAEVRTAELNGFRWHYGVICDEAVIFKAIPCTSSSALDRVVLPSMLERYPVHMVVGDVFGACVVIGTLVIPEGITDVGPFAFWGDKVERIELPSTVTNIDSNAFKANTYMEFIVSSENSRYASINGLLCSKDGKELIRGTGGVVKLPDSMVRIPEGAFFNRKIECVTIPGNIKEIGGAAFLCCEGLEDVVIPSGVKSIAEFTFARCQNLLYVEIPPSVTNIGAYAFEGCGRLREVLIPEGVTKIDEYAFANCRSLEFVSIPHSVKHIGEFAFSACSSGLEMSISAERIHISHNAFSITNNLVRHR